MDLDVEFVRSHFPAFEEPSLAGQSFFENAGGSFACRQTVDTLTRYYTATKVQPFGPYEASAAAGQAMDHSRARWATALGVATNEVQFGPSTSMNTYVLAKAFGQILGPGDEVVVTNQDHEANTGVFRRMADEVGATLVEWRTDPTTGLLDVDRLAALVTDRTRLVTVPHCSNIIGQENDIASAATVVHGVGARLIVDGVSFAPHTFPDVAALDADVYLFSLYKTYSVHQGLMVARNGILDELPNQGHEFNAHLPQKRLTPAGPDHAQEAAAGAVLDYVEALHRHHGGSPDDGLEVATRAVSRRWRDHESALLPDVLELLSTHPAVRLLGPSEIDTGGFHRCPTVAFVPLNQAPDQVAAALAARGVMCSSGNFYAGRVLKGVDVNADTGVVRVSWVHYADRADIEKLVGALHEIL